MNTKILKMSILLAAGAAVGLGGCQATRTDQVQASHAYNSGLSALLDADSRPQVDENTLDELLADTGEDANLESMIQDSYQTLERAFAQAESAGTPEPETVTQAVPDTQIAETETASVEPQEDVLASLPAEYDASGAGLAALASESEPATQPEPGDPTEAIRDASQDLADAILSQIPYSMNPAEDALALVGLEGLLPGVTEPALADGTFSDEERNYLEAALRFMNSVRSVDADPDAAVDTAQQIAMDLAESRPVRIVDAKLCTRVEGFGQYTTFPTSRFVAGHAQRVIVYVEVDRFGHTMVSPDIGDTSPRFAVELTQRIEVYHSADDVLALATPTLKDRRIGRKRFRDYYLVTAVDLPPTLSVGEYALKITIRDTSDDGFTQASIPFTVVADSSAVETDTP